MMSRLNSILIVDRAADEREMYAEYLCGQGYCTLQAQNAADAFRLATEQRPEVVVTEMLLALFARRACLADRTPVRGSAHAPCQVRPASNRSRIVLD